MEYLPRETNYLLHTTAFNHKVEKHMGIKCIKNILAFQIEQFKKIVVKLKETVTKYFFYIL